ncbi:MULTISPECIES: type VI secretion system baseplate subunit TssE [unclassified Motilimonas]|uniref:type VI secretion system baseplate subunit TssE n=1 Tax=Motilimonas TaxID=1914248 RepID=UPI001E358BBC|nr:MULTISPECIES: type VI secretion system baseplate subunit TssE [unclassified Motilimonas]MCE0557538.1 type VI secretion system baseplate subunit TssE [Motilimonas sp. E26]MDO6524578.1 type VI secretion system baseplate subunit TssE [Motilimonas sp. 1_MG-2023]
MSFWQTFINTKDGISPSQREVESVRYHLSQLLTSEAPLMLIDDSFQQVSSSSMRFGIEDMQLLQANLDNQQFAYQVEHWIKTFEPRLDKVSVELKQRDESKNAICFTLFAELRTEAGLQELVFDSKIKLSDLSATLEDEDLV